MKKKQKNNTKLKVVITLVLLIIIILLLLVSCRDFKNNTVQGTGELQEQVMKCDFGKFEKMFYANTLDEENNIFNHTLKNNVFTWCGTVIDVTAAGDLYSVYITPFAKHFTGLSWLKFSQLYPQRVPYAVRLETNDNNSKKLKRGDYIEIHGKLVEKGNNELEMPVVNEWVMEEGYVLNIKKHHKKAKRTTFAIEKKKEEKEELASFKQQQKESDEVASEENIEMDREEETRNNSYGSAESTRNDTDRESNYNNSYTSDDDKESTESAADDNSDNDTVEFEQSKERPVTKKFQNCDELKKVYPEGATDGDGVYEKNTHLDGDKDGSACDR